MPDEQGKLYSVERAGSLQGRFRKLFQNPDKILKPLVKPGMTVLDMGCGPGFYSIPAAQLAGEGGKIIAADLQQGMLDKLKDQIEGTELEERIILHKCEEDKAGVSEPVDLILAFHVVHELPDQKNFFNEMAGIVKPDGILFLAEPSFVVSKKKFSRTLGIAEECSFSVSKGPKIFMSKTAILSRAAESA